MSIDSNSKRRRDRSDQHAREIESSQQGLRNSIAETERLVGESNKMLERHRQERDDDDEQQDG